MNRSSWNMRDVPPPQRFAYWREAVCRNYLPLEPQALNTECFDGYLNSVSADRLHVSRIQTVAQAVRRTRGGIAAVADGSFFANLQVAGEAIVEQHGNRTRARPGDIVLVDTDLPFSIRFEQGCDIICATIPGDRLRRHQRQISHRLSNVISGQSAGRLAAAYLGALADIPDDLGLLDDLASDQLCALLVRALALDHPSRGPATSDRHAAQRILKFIEDELHNPQLSAKYACRRLNISRSHLFAALSSLGLAFASHIRQERLARSLSQIKDPRYADLALGDIARRWGFANQETFNRAFRRRYGVAPGACRSSSDAAPR
jgi:AraC-like DNA-binding protein